MPFENPLFNNKTYGYSSVGKYFQGPGLVDNLCSFSAAYGNSVYMIIDVFFYEKFTEKFNEQFKSIQNSKLTTELFGGQCCESEISRCIENAKNCGAKVVVAIGGGKTIDTAKAVGNRLGLPFIIMPTTASTDAPTSAVSIIYTEDDQFDHVDWYKSNPDVIFVDSSIITEAPVRFLSAGMGDALATYIEGRAYREANFPPSRRSCRRHGKNDKCGTDHCQALL